MVDESHHPGSNLEFQSFRCHPSSPLLSSITTFVVEGSASEIPVSFSVLLVNVLVLAEEHRGERGDLSLRHVSSEQSSSSVFRNHTPPDILKEGDLIKIVYEKYFPYKTLPELVALKGGWSIQISCIL